MFCVVVSVMCCRIRVVFRDIVSDFCFVVVSELCYVL